MLQKQRKTFEQTLIDLKIINKSQLKEAKQHQGNNGKKITQILLNLGHITEEDIIKVLQHQLDLQRVDFSRYVLNPHLSQYIPEKLAFKYMIVPLEQKGDSLKVATFDPYNLEAINDIKLTSGLNIKTLLATTQEIKQAINQIYLIEDEDTQEIFANLNELDASIGDSNADVEELRKLSEDAPIIKLSNLILTQAINLNASDIHIEPQNNRVRIRYRVDGFLIEKMTIPKHAQPGLISRMKVMANLDITNRWTSQDGRISIKINAIDVDMRISTVPTIYGEKIVVRLFNRDDKLLDVNKLGFTNDNLEIFQKIIEKPNGILLATGPTGSGKTTTLFAALNELNQSNRNIVTIEDPVEYKLENINQIQADPKRGMEFANVLKTVLRQDPDIIMVGEIRDEESAEIAIRAALTGHLVLSTLHTNSAIDSIIRLMDMGIPSYLVASSLVGIISQRLVRKVCDKCRVEYQASPKELALLGESIDKNIMLSKGEGCRYCNETGYKGRVAIQEVLLIDENLENMIVNKESKNKIKKYVKQKGMFFLEEDGKRKVLKGLTTTEELLRIIA